MVEEFIQNFHQGDFRIIDLFRNGYCYYFAVILKVRFQDGNIYYQPLNNHFIFGLNEKYYDVTGEIDVADTETYLWSVYAEVDKSHTKRIIRDCILKVAD